MRPAAVEAARPQPRMVRCQQRHAAFAFAVEDQQRLIFGAAHNHAAAVFTDFGLAEPAAPAWLGFGVGKLRRNRSGQSHRHRMLLAFGCDLGAERRFDDASRWRRRQHRRQRRLMDREITGVIAASGNQQRAAVLIDITRDVFIIVELQNALVFIAVENDQIEIVDLLRKQFARREGNQR